MGKGKAENSKESIRQHVSERYGKIAQGSGTCCTPDVSCCGDGTVTGTSGTAPEGISEIMGYATHELSRLPEGADMGLGCGNPVAIASLQEGQTVLDLGSGGGIDCFLAAKKVGKTGRVIGVDMTPDMVSKARANAEKMGAGNVEFRLGEIEHLPVADGSVDVIMSNCVINLSPEKEAVFREAHRVLKAGGRLAISDILTVSDLPEELRSDLELIGACIGGASTVDETRHLLEEAGFEDVTITPTDRSRTLVERWGSKMAVADAVISATIEAVKRV
ncbi:MAG: arsenite methyltransferase [bacterium]|nr:arsenite methyltransferase [bacterium]MDT8365482.1 arsenite methyltransferase [bacterium]